MRALWEVMIKTVQSYNVAPEAGSSLWTAKSVDTFFRHSLSLEEALAAILTTYYVFVSPPNVLLGLTGGSFLCQPIGFERSRCRFQAVTSTLP